MPPFIFAKMEKITCLHLFSLINKKVRTMGLPGIADGALEKHAKEFGAENLWKFQPQSL